MKEWLVRNKIFLITHTSADSMMIGKLPVFFASARGPGWPVPPHLGSAFPTELHSRLPEIQNAAIGMWTFRRETRHMRLLYQQQHIRSTASASALFWVMACTAAAALAWTCATCSFSARAMPCMRFLASWHHASLG